LGRYLDSHTRTGGDPTGSARLFGRALAGGEYRHPLLAGLETAFEASFDGPTVFDRFPEGLRLNAAGERLVPTAESVEDAVLTLERRRAAASPALSGTVRVSDQRVCCRISGSFPVGIDNDGAAARDHLGTGRVATDGKPRPTRSRYGVAPSAAGKRRLLRLQGRHLRLVRR
jgi:hypothetical protein